MRPKKGKKGPAVREWLAVLGVGAAIAIALVVAAPVQKIFDGLAAAAKAPTTQSSGTAIYNPNPKSDPPLVLPPANLDIKQAGGQLATLNSLTYVDANGKDTGLPDFEKIWKTLIQYLDTDSNCIISSAESDIALKDIFKKGWGARRGILNFAPDGLFDEPGIDEARYKAFIFQKISEYEKEYAEEHNGQRPPNNLANPGWYFKAPASKICGTMMVYVKDAQDRKTPVVNAQVTLTSQQPNGRVVIRGATDVKGLYLGGGMPNGVYTVTAVGGTQYSDDSATVTFKAGRPAPQLTIFLNKKSPGAIVEVYGQVRGSAKKYVPLEYASVYLGLAKGWTEYKAIMGSTYETGSVTFGAPMYKFTVNRGYHVVARKQGYKDASTDFTMVNGYSTVKLYLNLADDATPSPVPTVTPPIDTTTPTPTSSATPKPTPTATASATYSPSGWR